MAFNKEKKYCIYVLENKINGKLYYGQTCDYTRRMIEYRRKNKSKNSKIYRAIRKYNWSNFNSKVIVDNLCLEDANELEIYFIKLKNTTKTGYNITEGGGGSLGTIPSEDTKNKISNSKKGKKSDKKLLTEVQEIEIAEKYKKGFTNKELSIEYNCKSYIIKNAISNVFYQPKILNLSEKEKKIIRLEHLGKVNNQKRFTEKEEDDIIKKYQECVPVVKLKNEYNCCPSIIYKLFKRKNITINKKITF